VVVSPAKHSDRGAAWTKESRATAEGASWARDGSPRRGRLAWLAALGLAACLMVPSRAQAQASAVLVKDINQQVASYGVSPCDRFSAASEVVDVEGTAYFRGDTHDGTTGCELWKSDGTTAGTVLVKDILPGRGGSYPRHLTDVNGVLFFTACSAEDGFGQEDCELWKSDGTAEGTVRVKDVLPGNGSSFPTYLINVGGKLFFHVPFGSPEATGLWKSDGTESGTVRIRGIFPDHESLADIDGTLFFTEGDRTLWRSDGTEAGTIPVKDIFLGGFSVPRELTYANGRLFFTAWEEVHGRELWTSDGTEAGTVLVRDIVPGSGGSAPELLTNVNGTLFFAACVSGDWNDGDCELWKSDGTDAGTIRVRDILPGAGGSYPQGLTNVDGVLLFEACSASDEFGVRGDCELWKSDGTEKGTVRVKDIVPGVESSAPHSLTDVGGTLFFLGSDGLWKSDGSGAGTVRVRRFEDWKLPRDFVAVGTMVFFVANDELGGIVRGILWRSDGTEAGTVGVMDDLPAGTASSTPGSFAKVNGILFFAADDGMNGRELWLSNGTVGGTALVRDVRYGRRGSNPSRLTGVDGTLFFAASDALYRSDGTAPGTVLLAQGTSQPDWLTAVSGRLFFSMCSAVIDLGPYGLISHECELWSSDGTPAGTAQVKDIAPAGGCGFDECDSANPRNLTDVGGVLFFQACSVGGDNWSVPAYDCELWKSDGTEEGTVRVRDIMAGSGSSAPESLTDVNGTLFFVADDGVSGRELWMSDGTEAGTVRVKDIVPGTGGSAPESLTDVNGTLFFVADDGVSGRELWMSDGTETGTALVADVVPGARGSYPEQLTAVGSWLFFNAIGDDVGRELWRFCGGPPAECVLPSPVCQLLPGKRLVLKTKRGSAKGSIELVSTDSTISLGPGTPGGPDDPVLLNGGSLRIVTAAGDRFDDTYPLPASRWRYRKSGTKRGYEFRPMKPFRSVAIRPGKRIRVAAHGVGLGHTLGTDPAPVDVVLTIGAHCYCFHFDKAAVFKPGRKWVAKHVVAPSVCGFLAE